MAADEFHDRATDPRTGVEPLGQVDIDAFVPSHHGGLRQAAAEVEVVCRSPLDADPHPGRVYVRSTTEGRCLRHDEEGLDDDIGVGEGERLRPVRIDGHEADVDGAGFDRRHRVSGGRDTRQREWHAESGRQQRGEIDRHSSWAVLIALGRTGLPRLTTARRGPVRASAARA